MQFNILKFEYLFSYFKFKFYFPLEYWVVKIRIHNVVKIRIHNIRSLSFVNGCVCFFMKHVLTSIIETSIIWVSPLLSLQVLVLLSIRHCLGIFLMMNRFVCCWCFIDEIYIVVPRYSFIRLTSSPKSLGTNAVT